MKMSPAKASRGRKSRNSTQKLLAMVSEMRRTVTLQEERARYWTNMKKNEPRVMARKKEKAVR